MADVVVDQKPVELPAYDPNSIPEAVRKRVAAVEALYQSNPAALSQAEPPAPQASPGPSLSPSPPETPAVSSVSEPEPDPNSNTWKSRALSREGRLAKENEDLKRDLGELQEQMVTMATQQSAPPMQRPQQLPQYLTQEDARNYGPELLDLAQRASLHALAPVVQNLQQENAELRAQQARDKRRLLDQMVEAAVPDFRDIDRNPLWHKWLMGIDLMSGRVRQVLLNEAISAGNAPRVASFFNAFRTLEGSATAPQTQVPAPSPGTPPREASVNLLNLASPGRARLTAGGEASLSQSDKPIYTRADVQKAHRAYMQGAYRGREAEYERLQKDFVQAAAEGRFR
jgi:hypothetical protein